MNKEFYSGDYFKNLTEKEIDDLMYKVKWNPINNAIDICKEENIKYGIIENIYSHIMVEKFPREMLEGLVYINMKDGYNYIYDNNEIVNIGKLFNQDIEQMRKWMKNH